MRRKVVDEAWTALEDMQRQGISADKFTVSRMLMKTVGDGRNRWNPARVYRGIALVEKFIDLQPKDVDEVLFNALLDMCFKLKDLSRLEATVQRMKGAKGLTLSCDPWNFCQYAWSGRGFAEGVAGVERDGITAGASECSDLWMYRRCMRESAATSRKRLRSSRVCDPLANIGTPFCTRR